MQTRERDVTAASVSKGKTDLDRRVRAETKASAERETRVTCGHFLFFSRGVFPTIDHVSDARRGKFRMNWSPVRWLPRTLSLTQFIKGEFRRNRLFSNTVEP